MLELDPKIQEDTITQVLVKNQLESQKKICNSCHADGLTPDGNMYRLIQRQRISSQAQIELTHLDLVLARSKAKLTGE